MNDDLYELMANLANIDRYAHEDEEIEGIFYDLFNIGIDPLENLIKALLPLCCIAESPLTGKLYQGFGTDNTWLIKQEVKQEVK